MTEGASPPVEAPSARPGNTGEVRKVVQVAAVLMLLAACHRGSDDPTVSAGGSTTTSSEDTTTTEFTGGTLPVEAPASTVRAYLRDVRIASHDGYDRVVFEFEDGVPGYRVATTTRPVTEDGSGRTVDVAGSTLVQVRMENAATARITGDTVTRVYTGPPRVDTRGALVEEVVDTGDFEGIVTWVIGLDAPPAGVKVSTLTSPFRLVVDLGVPH
jgi:hypothetical protein